MRLTGAKQRAVEPTGEFSSFESKFYCEFGEFFLLFYIERSILLLRWFEHQQTEAGVKRVKDWAAAKNSRLDDSDIFISGNADEVFKNL